MLSVRTSFEPSIAVIYTPHGEVIELEFTKEDERYVANFSLQKGVVLGNYTLIVDEHVERFVVDFYTIRAGANGPAVNGSVEYYVKEPTELRYELDGSVGVAPVVNGSFTVPVDAGAQMIKLYCGNAVLELPLAAPSTRRAVDYEGMQLNVSVDRGSIEYIDVADGMLNISISVEPAQCVNLSIELPFDIPSGMHIYYWKGVGGRYVPVPYRVEDRRRVVFELQDGVTDEDEEVNGMIRDPLLVYVPRYNVSADILGGSGVLHVRNTNNTHLYDIEVSVSHGSISYLSLVDSENVPEPPAVFPFHLIKLAVEGVSVGEEVVVNITYPYDVEGSAYYKLNPHTLAWRDVSAGEGVAATISGRVVSLRLKDGGAGDDDGVANGVIEDDGGVGWVGYADTNGIYIGKKQSHSYWVYIPEGDSFTIRYTYKNKRLVFFVYDPSSVMRDSFVVDIGGMHTVSTGGMYGWWRLEAYQDSRYQDNRYGITIMGPDNINMRFNESWVVNGTTYYGSPEYLILSKGDVKVPNEYTYYLYASEFSLAIYDTDNTKSNRCLRVDIYAPNGSLYYSAYPGEDGNGDEEWREINISGELGVWRLFLKETGRSTDVASGSNKFILAVDMEDGLWFKEPLDITATLHGHVLEDFEPIGARSASDVGVVGATVVLLRDSNANFVPDTSDLLLSTTRTNSSGGFSFSVLLDITKTYFVVVDSRTVLPSEPLNSGYTTDDLWAEQTYQTELSAGNWTIVQRVGGYDPLVSDAWEVDRYEHWVSVPMASYVGKAVEIGFSFSVVANTRDADDNQSSNRSAQGTLRQAILNTNALQGEQECVFMISASDSNYSTHDGMEVWTIRLSEVLPHISDSTVLNARTQPGTSHTLEGETVGVDAYQIPDLTTPRIELNANGKNGLLINGTLAEDRGSSPRAVSIEGLSIYGFHGYGVKLVGDNTTL
ncbi:MAG: choice-of-anchor U domain-containing protein, partial [Methermicoccaceae archaeon]